MTEVWRLARLVLHRLLLASVILSEHFVIGQGDDCSGHMLVQLEPDHNTNMEGFVLICYNGTWNIMCTVTMNSQTRLDAENEADLLCNDLGYQGAIYQGMSCLDNVSHFITLNYQTDSQSIRCYTVTPVDLCECPQRLLCEATSDSTMSTRSIFLCGENGPGSMPTEVAVAVVVVIVVLAVSVIIIVALVIKRRKLRQSPSTKESSYSLGQLQNSEVTEKEEFPEPNYSSVGGMFDDEVDTTYDVIDKFKTSVPQGSSTSATDRTDKKGDDFYDAEQHVYAVVSTKHKMSSEGLTNEEEMRPTYNNMSQSSSKELNNMSQSSSKEFNAGEMPFMNNMSQSISSSKDFNEGEMPSMNSNISQSSSEELGKGEILPMYKIESQFNSEDFNREVFPNYSMSSEDHNED